MRIGLASKEVVAESGPRSIPHFAIEPAPASPGNQRHWQLKLTRSAKPITILPIRGACLCLASFALCCRNLLKMVITMVKRTGEEHILTIKEVAGYLKVTERTIYRLSQAKKIPAFKVGGMWRFMRVDIEAWIARQTSASVTNNK